MYEIDLTRKPIKFFDLKGMFEKDRCHLDGIAGNRAVYHAPIGGNGGGVTGKVAPNGTKSYKNRIRTASKEGRFNRKTTMFNRCGIENSNSFDRLETTKCSCFWENW